MQSGSTAMCQHYTTGMATVQLLLAVSGVVIENKCNREHRSDREQFR